MCSAVTLARFFRIFHDNSWLGTLLTRSLRILCGNHNLRTAILLWLRWNKPYIFQINPFGYLSLHMQPTPHPTIRRSPTFAQIYALCSAHDKRVLCLVLFCVAIAGDFQFEPSLERLFVTRDWKILFQMIQRLSVLHTVNFENCCLKNSFVWQLFLHESCFWQPFCHQNKMYSRANNWAHPLECLPL